MVYHRRMRMSEEELARRLAEADRMRATLRRCTLEWLGVKRVLADRRRGPERSDDGRPARR
jgi:hypothetical protein